LADVIHSRPAETAAQRIRAWILEGLLPAGKRLPSERALAERLAVSRAAVRSAFESLESEGLIVAQPRRARVVRPEPPRARRNDLLTHTLAALVAADFGIPGDDRHGPAWGLRLTHALAQVSLHAGFATLFISEEQLRGRGMEQFHSSPPRGLALVHSSPDLPSREALLHSLQVNDIAMAAWADEHDWPGCDVVLSDHQQGSFDLARWLIERGARRLLRIRPDGAGGRDWIRRRDEGFERALRDAGLPVLAPLEIPGNWHAVHDEEHFRQAAHLLAGYLYRHLAGATPVDALLVVTDSQVAATAAACRILGRDPRRGILLAGYDSFWAECAERKWEPTPPHVTVDKDDGRIGSDLAGLLLARIAGRLPAETQRHVLAQRIVGTDEA
jgi:DNA-binding LacI/PurR family transcriptional regulator/DNA-binding transcriptional regulator YhcF (GntR family)